MIDFILEGLARSAIALTLSAVFAWLLLTSLRPRSLRVHQVVWFLVILQAASWQPIGLAVLAPPVEPLAVVDSSTEPQPLNFAELSPPVGRETPTVVAEVERDTLSAASATEPKQPWSWKPILLGIWIVGAALLLLLGGVDYLKLQRRLVRESSPIPPKWVADWQSLPHRGRELVATQTLGPLAVRTPRKSIVALPRDFGESLTSQQRRAVLSHELSHLRSGDPFWMLFVWLATSVQWFNPFVWLASRRFHAAAELACDDRLDEPSRLPLAQVLLSLAQPNPPTALAMSGGTLAARIRALAMPKANEPRWKSPLVAALVVAALSIGWIRLEAKQPPKKERVPSEDVEKKKAADDEEPRRESRSSAVPGKQIGKKKKAPPEGSNVRNVPLPEMIRDSEEKMKKLDVEKNAARERMIQIDNDRTKVLNDLKALEAEKKAPSNAQLRIEEFNKRFDDAQRVFQQKSAEYVRLRRDAEAMRYDLQSSRNKLETLWIRGLRQANPQDEDALALEKTLSYLAAREPKFGVAEILPYEEHVETEAVLKLEALLNRNIKPQGNETYRQAQERILQTPPSEARKRLAEMRANLKQVQSELPNWEDRRDYWLNLVADLFHSVAKKKVYEVWSAHIAAAGGGQKWTPRYFYWAAIRNTRDNNAIAVLSFQNAVKTGERDFDRAMLLRSILIVETMCKANLPFDNGLWESVRYYFHLAPQWPKGKDPRQGDLVWTRIHTMLKACENSIHRERGKELRTLIAQDSAARVPASGIDKLMELEGATPYSRVQFFLNRQVSVNFQGRGFSNAFAELRSIAAVPLVVLSPGWESNLRPVTLNAEAKWIDIVREVCRQVELPFETSETLTLIGHSTGVASNAKRRLQKSPPFWQQKLETPTFLNTSETPAREALRFLSTQTSVPITLLADEDFDQNAAITIDVDRAPLAVALEAACLSIGCVWIPVGDLILIVPQGRKVETEAKVSEFQAQLKRLREAAAKGEAAAKAMTSATFIDFTETPLSQGLLFLQTQHSGLEVESRVADREKPITLAVTGVPPAEGLALIAWSHDLKLTFEGSKAVLSDK
jgi:beta-lactamase regulating signal transducer with metallopeptidase domain